MVLRNLHIQYKYITLIMLAAGICACEKQEVDFGGNSLTDDPNIIVIDTISVNASTFKLDSFSTLNTGYFIAGSHFDSSFGKFQSTAYFDLDIPYDSSGTLKGCTSCYFDSMVAITKFSGGYYGDTTQLFTLNINRLTQLIDDNTTFGYNTTIRNYNTSPVGTFSAKVSPSRQNTIRIKLSDDLGKDLYNKIQRNSDTITDGNLFLDYMKGFCFTGTNTNNTVYYMKPPGDSDFVMLYYHKNAPLPVNYVVKFPMNAAHQFNGFASDYSGTNLAVFTSKKTQTISSVQTNGYVYMHENNGLFPRFSFPSLYSLKELAPYINIVSAVLEIFPVKGSYGIQSFYTLPQSINAYVVNEYDETQNYLYYSGTSDLQTGNLSIDNLYSENTKYIYDVSNYVNTVLFQGNNGSLDLVLKPAANAGDSTEQRLLLKALNNSSFKLKLNVLGL